MTDNAQHLEARTTYRRQEVCREAQLLFQQSTDWVTFFRKVLGLNGLVRNSFPTPQQLEAFEQTQEYFAIQGMLAELRKGGTPADTGEEPTRVITVRLPKSLHESLRVEAHDHHTSMNKLCISKLLQIINENLIPDDGRSPKQVQAEEAETPPVEA